MRTRRQFWLILALTVVAIVIAWPRVPVKLDLGPIHVDTVIAGPDVDLLALNIPYYRELNIKQGLDLQGGTQVILSLDMSEVSDEDRQTAQDSAVSVLSNRVNFTGATEAVVQPARVGDDYRVIVELPGVSDTSQAVELIGQTAQLEFREFTDPTTTSDTIPTMENTKSTGLTGKDLEQAVVDTTQSLTAPAVAITFTEEGGRKFAELTSRLVGKPLPVFLDQQPLTWPMVNQAITDGQGIISGGFDTATARQLALQLSAGALPVPIEVVEQRTVGATLGQASIEKSLIAGVVGLVLVMLFMALKYGRLGLVANLALSLYALYVLAIFKWVPVTLTLAGIAGFILSIGMAVDANILIFERLREELRRGSKIRPALDTAFHRAWPSIRDSNIATFITCGILYFFGTGMVRGFALTLAIGVAISMLTAVFITREILRLAYGAAGATAPASSHSRYAKRVRPDSQVVEGGLS